ncbi:oligosaccharide flippase family protein [Marinobacter maroccanus]|uniref:oligosaccharide flippase family protein n=1 Tax=Marinobacter maroccanus TaxID=2055143 RepID=UPI001304E24F|nr:oligosaccharide flippase family protein [Marinobacter maroccanus]
MSLRSRFLKLLFGPVITLLTGMLSGPLISRLFTPEEFGRYSVLLAIVGIAVVAVTIRFEQLIPTSKDPAASFWIVVLSAVVGALALGGIAYPFFALEEALFIALATLAVAVFNGFYYLRVNADEPLRASAGRAVQAAGVLGGQASFGAAGWGIFGLIWGELVGRFASLLFVLQKVDGRSVAVLKREFGEQWPAAKWLLPGSLLGALALQLLPLGMAISVGAASAGIFLLVYRMVVIPNSILSKVASDTLLVEFSRLEKDDLPIRNAVENGFRKLTLTAVCLYGSLAIYGGWLFSVLLGDQWSNSSVFIPWLALLVAFWSIASPLAMVFVSLQKTRWSFGLSSLDVLNRCFALFVGFFYQDVLAAAVSLAIGGAFVYGATVASAMRVSGASFAGAIAPVLLSGAFVVFLLIVANVLFEGGSWELSIVPTILAFSICGKKLLYG